MEKTWKRRIVYSPGTIYKYIARKSNTFQMNSGRWTSAITIGGMDYQQFGEV